MSLYFFVTTLEYICAILPAANNFNIFLRKRFCDQRPTNCRVMELKVIYFAYEYHVHLRGQKDGAARRRRRWVVPPNRDYDEIMIVHISFTVCMLIFLAPRIPGVTRNAYLSMRLMRWRFADTFFSTLEIFQAIPLICETRFLLP